ncbi:hypothetical protein [Actinomadura miaoliensis]|uniref:Uncharacterized protein n=1 Tax=Actinomadura miaoliensis TaxID=430685 RepID=A0ABP7X0B9_9ACTN
MEEDISRHCPVHDIGYHLTGVDYDEIMPGCVLPTGSLNSDLEPAGTVVTAVEVYGPGEHPLSELTHTPPAEFTIVLYRTVSGRTYDAWVRPQYAHRIGCHWPEGTAASRQPTQGPATPSA